MNDILSQLEQGKVRVAIQTKDGSWEIDSSIKQAILEAFKFRVTKSVHPENQIMAKITLIYINLKGQMIG